MPFLKGQQLADELEVEAVVTAQLVEQCYLVGTQDRVVIDATARIGHASNLLVDAREGIFDLVLLDDPDSPNDFQFFESNEVDVLYRFRAANPDVILGLETCLLRPSDFSLRCRDFIQLSESAIARTIQRAHRLGACLAEFHSHRLPGPAAFSLTDRSGLYDTVPHMRWRLAGRPYIAVVVAPGSFDALIWTHEQGMVPEPIAAIQVGAELLPPTHLSLEGWNGHKQQPL